LERSAVKIMAGRIYCGDNLEVLSLPEFFQTEMVDLVYLDPPFNSKRTYNIVYKGSNAQDAVFKDYWTWTEAAPTFDAMVNSPHMPRSLRPLLESLHARLVDDDDDLLAYLTMMTPRLVACHRVLKKTGTLYLHCDPTASHYLKVVLDALFGSRRFLAEVVWKRTFAHGDPQHTFGNVTDSILVYTKSETFTFNPQSRPFDRAYIKKRTHGVDADGRAWQSVTLRSPSPRPNLVYDFTARNGIKYRPHPNGWSCDIDRMRQYDRERRLHFPKKPGGQLRFKMYWDEPRQRQGKHAEQPEVLVQSLWDDIPPINSQAKERLGYPTQKPLALLERILRASSNQGDVVLDPFCGCGTTVEACERMGRRWFGIDITHKAIKVIEDRFAKVGLEEPEIVWQPATAQDAYALADAPGKKAQFEKWALRKIRAARVRARDRGIDGEALFRDGEQTYHAIVSVKAGGVKPGDVRDLRGTMDREHAPIGVFVTRVAPSEEMRREAVRLGFLDVSDGEGPIPRIQFVSVDRMFGPLPAIRAPGVNATQMPKPTIPPAPMSGDQLTLAIDQKVRDVRPPVKAKARTEVAEPAGERAPRSKAGRTASRRSRRQP
jgi:site-specific DNA-methyltransferase (adenine-specific)